MFHHTFFCMRDEQFFLKGEVLHFVTFSMLYLKCVGICVIVCVECSLKKKKKRNNKGRFWREFFFKSMKHTFWLARRTVLVQRVAFIEQKSGNRIGTKRSVPILKTKRRGASGCISPCRIIRLIYKLVHTKLCTITYREWKKTPSRQIQQYLYIQQKF